ncbi:hypothetical protein [Lacipirellula sp.]|uniref:hypothetical protein n=1 Tax=Lacipirellula sp. TaxID=2691419 RepID=UPI003D11C573
MRITRKSYEKARAAVVEAREQIKIVKAWEDALRQLGSLGNQQIVAITISEDGGVRTECQLLSAGSDRPAAEGILDASQLSN